MGLLINTLPVLLLFTFILTKETDNSITVDESPQFSNEEYEIKSSPSRTTVKTTKTFSNSYSRQAKSAGRRNGNTKPNIIDTFNNKTFYPDLLTKGSNTSDEKNNNFRIICYFTNWAWYRSGAGKFLPSNINPSLCTHIMYSFAKLDPNSLTMAPFDTWADIDNKFYQKVVAYKAKGIKVMISLGGWTDSAGNKYSGMVNNPSARANFIKHAIQFMEKYGFQGLDIDWEFPKCWQANCGAGPNSDKEAYAAWIEELHQAFKPKGLLLSAAVSPSKLIIDQGFDVAKLSNSFDLINVMTYDYHGSWDRKTGHLSPLHQYPGDSDPTFNSDFSIHYWMQKGANPKKINMGLPLYGTTFTLANPSNNGLNAPTNGPGQPGEFTRAGGSLAYYEICDRTKRHGWKVVRDPQGRIGPYAFKGNQWVSYDDPIQLRKKAQFIKDLGLGGAFVWALSFDDYRNRCGDGNNPLLTAINQELRGIPTKDG